VNDARAQRVGVGLALSIVGLVVLAPSPAWADLSSDADRLVRAWRDGGAEVVRLPPRFLEEGQIWGLPMRHGDDASGCTTLALLGTRSMEFEVSARRSLDGLGVPEREPSRLSADAGFAMVSRCGSRREAWAHTVVEMRARRGVVEAIVVRTSSAVRSPFEILPEREPIDRRPQGHPGPPARPEPIEVRRARASRRARAEGAEQVVTIPLRSSAAGTGEFEVQLGEGCHRLELMAAMPQLELLRSIDMDAELRVVGTKRLLGRDRGDAVDAHMEVCLGEKTSLLVSYVGAGGETDVALTTSTWTIPEWVPSLWGPTARAGFATALRQRTTPTPTTGPLLRALGAQGSTRIPMTVEAGACYLAAVAMVRGQNTGLRVRASVDARTSFEALPAGADGIVLTFCSGHSERAMLEVETRGQAPRWALAVWPVGAAAP